MKKITTLLLLFVSALILVVAPAYAEETDGLIHLYPYDNVNTMKETGDIPTGSTRVLDSFWRTEYNGYKYFHVRNATRFVSDFTYTEADKQEGRSEYFISTIPAISYSAFASLIINDTDDDIILTTTNQRGQLTAGVRHFIWAYFNEDGELAMFEDKYVGSHHITNDGTAENPDWRLSTEAEIEAYEADLLLPAEERVFTADKMRSAFIRMIMNENDQDGYVLEPLKSLDWINPDVPADQELKSNLLDYNPNFVKVPAGWTVISFGANDRSATWNTKTIDFIKSFPYTMLNEEVAPVVHTYETQNPIFAGLTALDDDAVTPGVQMIVEFNQENFDLPNTVSSSWIHMYGDNGEYLNETEKLNYTVDIYDSVDFNSVEEEHVPTVLETVTFEYDSQTDTYTPDKALSVVDSSVFGAGYTAVYSSTHPENGTTKVIVDIAVGVLPPRFENVKNRYVDESVFVDLLGDITANDGYGNDKTGDIKITAPAGFNVYNPKPGTYKIDLEFTHNVFIPGIPAIPYTLDLAGVEVVANKVNETGAYVGNTTLYTESFTYVHTGAASIVFAHFDSTGKMIQSVDRSSWNTFAETAVPNLDSDAKIKAWLEGIDFSNGSYVVAFGVSGNQTAARALRFGDTVALTMGDPGTPDFSQDIVTKTSYNLTVDDKTAPQAIVVNNNLTIEADAFASAEAAILSNIVAVDNYDSRTQLSLYVLNNGGLSLTSGKLSVGTYTVTVGVEDRAGNASEVSYTLTVKAAKPTQEEVDQKVDEKAEDVEAQIPQDTITPDQVEEAIQDALDSYDGVSVLTAVLMSLGAALVSFGGAALLFFLKKK